MAIQNGHCISCEGYHQPTVRTGYEEIIPHRSGEMFAFTAKKPGKVISIKDKGIIVEYQDGERQGFELGRRFGNAAGLVIPHSIVTPLKVDDAFEVGEAIVYNDGFFEPDFLNPKRIIFKTYTTVKTVLWESNQTLEDASSISTRVAEKLKTRVTKVKNIIVRFDQTVNRLVKAGDNLDSDTVLCIIEDAITASSNLFTDETLDTLKVVGSQTPRAHVKGIVERVEVYYHGDKEDMSESLQQLANQSDKQFKRDADALGKKAYTGSVDTGFRIENDPLALDTAAIRIYITTNAGASIGDKAVFANQLKTVISDVMEEDMVTEDGVLIDAVFGYQSCEARVINSAFVIGTTNTLLELIAKKACDIYFSGT